LVQVGFDDLIVTFLGGDDDDQPVVLKFDAVVFTRGYVSRPARFPDNVIFYLNVLRVFYDYSKRTGGVLHHLQASVGAFEVYVSVQKNPT
jgi:hypothetical protein